jgi:ATP-dependent helicase Lhr and Lhr-like helicase
LEAFEAPAVEWERSILPARVANYSPAWLDQLCLSGAVGWGRTSPHPAWSSHESPARPRRVIPTNAAPITFYMRDHADWLPYTLAKQSIDEATLAQALSPEALHIRAELIDRGACFAADLQRWAGFTRQQTAHALWELATAGLAAADGFDQLRALMDPRRKSTAHTEARRPTRTSAGRWSLLLEPAPALRPDPIARARETETALESFARILLARYGVLFRDLLARESNAPRWRDLVGILRRLEARGEVRGGRFVSGFSGEQFALPQAIESLRSSRTENLNPAPAAFSVSAADPLNLAGILTQEQRVPAIPGRIVQYANGRSAESESGGPASNLPVPLVPVSPAIGDPARSATLF